MKWYYHDGSKQIGPVEETQIIELINTGVITRTTNLWKENTPSWIIASSSELVSYLRPEPPLLETNPIPPPLVPNPTPPMTLPSAETNVGKTGMRPQTNNGSTAQTANQQAVSTPALWNPNSACNWCLLFTPIFGGLIQSSNWNTLGESTKAKQSMIWGWITIPIIVLSMFLESNTARGLNFAYLIVWYFAIGQQQARYVKKLYGTNYVHKPWGKPLGIAAAIFVVVVIVIFVIGAMTGGETPQE